MSLVPLSASLVLLSTCCISYVSGYGNLSYPSTTFNNLPIVNRNLTIPWSVYLAGAVYGLMYSMAVSGAAMTGRKKRDSDDEDSNSIYGQIGKYKLASPFFPPKLYNLLFNLKPVDFLCSHGLKRYKVN
jgi:hypothetical protein